MILVEPNEHLVVKLLGLRSLLNELYNIFDLIELITYNELIDEKLEIVARDHFKLFNLFK
jgi:hypothetical protein